MNKKIRKSTAPFFLCLCILLQGFCVTAAETEAPSPAGFVGNSEMPKAEAGAGISPADGSGETEEVPKIKVTERSAFHPVKENTYYELLVPTQLTKIGDTYYLVDSYHNQVLCSRRLEPPALKWSVMADGLNRPHAIAGDGEVFLVADTDNHRIISYVKSEDAKGYTEKQVFDNVGVRPHYIVYDEKEGLFYAWSSLTGEMYLFRRRPDSTEVYLEGAKKIPELDGKYVRSFTIEDDRIYFPCVEESAIISADRETFSIKDIYPVPEKMAGMVQLAKIQNYYYLTVSTDSDYNRNAAVIVRGRSLEGFAKGNYEKVDGYFEAGATPYYISEVDSFYYTVVLGGSAAACGYRFEVEKDQFCNVRKAAGGW